MNRWVVLALCPLIVAAAWAGFRVPARTEVGSTDTHKLNMEFSYDSMKVAVTSQVKSEVTAFEDGTATLKGDWSGLQILVDGTPWPAPSQSTMTYTTSADGTLRSVTGGLPGVDNIRTMLLFSFVVPPTEMAVGDSYETTYSNPDSRIPEVTYRNTYRGEDQGAHKFDVTLSESGKAFSATGSFWVTAEGSIKKLEMAFKSLPVPTVGSSVDGTVSATLAE